jgi:hypothetical protein
LRTLGTDAGKGFAELPALENGRPSFGAVGVAAIMLIAAKACRLLQAVELGFGIFRQHLKPLKLQARLGR